MYMSSSKLISLSEILAKKHAKNFSSYIHVSCKQQERFLQLLLREARLNIHDSDATSCLILYDYSYSCNKSAFLNILTAAIISLDLEAASRSYSE